jgi:hypothetical protein
LDDRRLHVALCVAAEDYGKTFVELRAGFSADKTASASYPMLKKLIGESSSYGTVTDVHKKLRAAREKLTACLNPASNAHITDEVVERHGCDVFESIPKTRREHPVLRILPDEVWQAHNLELWCEGWVGGSDKRRKSVIASLGWAMLSRYLREKIVPKVIQDGAMIRWLLHFARELRMMSSQQPTWWEGDNRFDDTVPELEAPEDLSQATTEGSNPSGSVPDGARRSERQRLSVAKKAAPPADVSLSLPTLSSVRAAKQQAPPPPKPQTIAATSRLVPPKPSATTSKHQRGEMSSHAPTRQAPKSKPVISSDVDELANDEHNSGMIEEEDIVPPTNPRDRSVGPDGPGDYSEQEDPVGEHEQLGIDQSDDMVNAFELIRRFAPDHLVGICRVSGRYPQNYWGMQVSRRGQPGALISGDTPEKQDNALTWFARQNADSAMAVLPLIKEEREKLRRSVFHIVRSIMESPYANDIAMTSLVPTILSYRVSNSYQMLTISSNSIYSWVLCACNRIFTLCALPRY